MTQDTTNKWTYTPPVKTLTPANVYRRAPVTPAGYEIVAFRVPKEGEVIIALDGNIMFDVDGHYTEPRFILAKIPERPTVVPNGYELTGEYREARMGEPCYNGSLFFATGTKDKHWILRKLPEQPATAPDGYEFTGEYRQAVKGEYVCFDNTYSYAAKWYPSDPTDDKYWILRPIPTPTLRDIYGTDSPVIPDGWESTGVLRLCKTGDASLDVSGKVSEWHIDPLPCSKNPRLILRKKTEAVKPEPKFKVGDWVRGDSGYHSHVGMLARVEGWAEFEDGSIFYLHELTPVAAPPAGFTYTKV